MKSDFSLESGMVKLEHFVGAELLLYFLRIFLASRRQELCFANVSRAQRHTIEGARDLFGLDVVDELTEGGISITKLSKLGFAKDNITIGNNQYAYPI